MLGLGAGAVLVKPTLLLGAEAEGIVLPAKGLAKSWVVYPGREIGCMGMAPLAREYVISPTFTPGVDPHEVFYKASLELQRRLGEETLARLMDVPEPLRQHVEVVTSVFMPIHARTKHCWATAEEAARLTDEDFEGFDVVADCAIEVKGYGVRGREEREALYGAGWTPPKTAEVFSTTGEYPVEMPSNLDLGHLMSIDAKLFAGDASMQKRLGRITLGVPLIAV